MAKTEDLPHHKHPEIVGVFVTRPPPLSKFQEEYWRLDVKGVGSIRISARDVRNYEKFCGECSAQCQAVFDPMPQHEWTELLRAAVYKARRENDGHLPFA